MHDPKVEQRVGEQRVDQRVDQRVGDVDALVRADVGRLLGCDGAAIDPEEDLLDRGLDSVRLMTLVERWRAAGLGGVEFADLAEQPRLSAWVDLIRSGGAR
ncbi:phosphopantetheine-binding protein [Kineococcus sp. SYSU DK005]|uniref:phosphopantetheine-binding protein n=1 Tax=Kineococcus sp. SYSU DK005 TaxID=3383126 RepID=UPI003D7F122D